MVTLGQRQKVRPQTQGDERDGMRVVSPEASSPCIVHRPPAPLARRELVPKLGQHVSGDAAAWLCEAAETGECGEGTGTARQADRSILITSIPTASNRPRPLGRARGTCAYSSRLAKSDHVTRSPTELRAAPDRAGVSMMDSLVWQGSEHLLLVLGGAI